MWEKIANALLNNPLVEWIESTIGLPSPWSAVALYGVIILILVVIIVIIATSCAKAKKKARLAASQENAASEEVKTEETPATEEVKTEETLATEEVKTEETLATEEVKTEEVKEETIVEEKVEEKPTPKAKKEEKVEEKVASKKVSKAAGKYVIVQEGPNWRYKLKASNGEVIIISEPYSTEKAVRNGIETLKKNIEISRCDIIEDKHGLFSFRVITKQGRCLATSANYKTKVRAESASESYKRWATSETVIVDDTGNVDHMEVEKIEVEIKEEHNGKFVVKQEQNGFVYQLIASNGRIIATSNIYKSKESCLEALEKFRVCVYEGSFYVYKDKNSRFQFKLYNKQNRLVLAGEVYEERNRAVAVIESIKKLAKYAVVVDHVIETAPEEVKA